MPLSYRLGATASWRMTAGMVGAITVLALVYMALWSGRPAAPGVHRAVKPRPTTVKRRIMVRLDNRPEGYGARQPSVHFLPGGWRYYEVHGDKESVWWYIGPDGETIEERVSVCYGCVPQSP